MDAEPFSAAKGRDERAVFGDTSQVFFAVREGAR